MHNLQLSKMTLKVLSDDYWSGLPVDVLFLHLSLFMGGCSLAYNQPLKKVQRSGLLPIWHRDLSSWISPQVI